ncbi:MAG: hypothetical protein ACRDTG_10990 [Pseudonocardiaceae bacterium]
MINYAQEAEHRPELEQHDLRTRHPPSPALPRPYLCGGDSPEAGRPVPDHSAVATRRLTGPELLDWIALRRVSEGGVTMLGAHYLDHGQRVPCYLPEAVRRLADAELTELLDPNHPGGAQRVVITSRGRTRYQELNAICIPAQRPT